MDFLMLVLIAIGLAMDAFAVAICNGITVKTRKIRHAAAFGLMFGGMQLIMPIAGFLLGSSFSAFIESIDHWIAFALLSFIGGKMLGESFRADNGNKPITGGEALSLGKLFALGVATSIDAFAVGVSIALTGWNIWISSLIIGGVAFAFSFAGVLAGQRLGGRFQKSAGKFGGIVLIGIGVKMLVEHLTV